MFDKLKNFTGNFLKNKKSNNIILVLGLIGIALIAFSDVFSTNLSKKNVSKEVQFNAEKYIYKLENKTKGIVSSIEGAGKCKIMITLEESQEIELFYDKSISKENSNGVNRNQEEKKLVVIEGENGEDKFITQKSIEPKIKGVLVLVEGGDDIKINEIITEAVKTLLGIPSSKICVTKLK